MILAIDIGSTFLKVAVVDFKGTILFFEKRAVSMASNNDTFEVDPKYWIDGVKALSASISERLMEKITSIVVSGNGPTIIPVDNKGLAVGNAYLWMDSRANSVTQDITEKLGVYLPPNFFLSKVYWLNKAKNSIYSRASSFLACPEYICYLLTGKMFTLLPEKGFKPYYWDNEKIDKLGLSRDKFPPFISPYQIYGEYNGFLKIPGLKKNIPVICGGPDFTMSVLGSGSITEGILCDRTGTSEGLNYCSSTPYVIEGLRTLPHLVKDLFTVAGLIPSAGECVLTNRLDLLLDQYKSIIGKMISNGLDIKEIRIIGGHAGIEILNKKKADCFPFPVKIYPEGSDLIGNAVLGSVVTKYYSDFNEACSVMVKEQFCYNV